MLQCLIRPANSAASANRFSPPRRAWRPSRRP